MILLMRKGSTGAQAGAVLRKLEASGLKARVLRGSGRPLIHVLSKDAELSGDILRSDGLETILWPGGRRAMRPFYPYHFINWCIAALLLLCALALLAAFLPPGLGPQADLERPPRSLEPPWFFRGLDQFLSMFPPGLSWLGTAAAILFWVVLFLLPGIDRSSERFVWQHRGILALGLAAVAFFVWLSLRGLLW
jgi:quinol-cytochrome oxidoreductase complex cytochrome b subunit